MTGYLETNNGKNREYAKETNAKIDAIDNICLSRIILINKLNGDNSLKHAKITGHLKNTIANKTSVQK